MKISNSEKTPVVKVLEYGKVHIYPYDTVAEVIYEQVLAKVTIRFRDGTEVTFGYVDSLEY